MIPFWVKGAVVAALMASLVVGWNTYQRAVYQRGYDFAVTERKLADDEKLAIATIEARQAERVLRDQLEVTTTKRLQENADHEQTVSDLRAAARRGDIRMRAPVAPSVCADTAAAHPGPAGGPASEAPELLPEAADAVLDIARRSAQDVRDRDELIRLYSAMRDTCNAP